mgnify:CR=1 FL=1
MFPTCIVKIFGITNGGFITTMAFFAVPISSISSFLFVFWDIEPQYIFVVGALLTFCNLIILCFFDDSEMVRKPNFDKFEEEKEELSLKQSQNTSSAASPARTI